MQLLPVERRRRHGVALAQHHVVGDAASPRPLPVPPVHTAAAEPVDQAPVPTGRRSPCVRLRIGRRIVQHRDLIDRPVDSAGLEADDIRDVRARQGRRRGEIGRTLAPIRQRLERVVLGGTVGVVDPALDRAVLIQRRPQGVAGRQLERLRLANERLLVRSGDDRPLDRVIDERQRGGRRVGAVRHGQVVTTQRQPVDQPDETVMRVVGPEPIGDVSTVQRDTNIRQRRPIRSVDTHQRIAARDHVGPARQRGESERAPDGVVGGTPADRHTRRDGHRQRAGRGEGDADASCRHEDLPRGPGYCLAIALRPWRSTYF